MNTGSDPVALAERQVAEARTAALAECRVLRANLHRRAGSPLFIGSALLGAIALGYFATRRGKAKRPMRGASRGAWSQAFTAVRVLLPLLLALGAATRPARRPAADIVATKR